MGVPDAAAQKGGILHQRLVKQMQDAQKSIVDKAIHQNLQGRVDLASHIEKIINGKEESEDINLKEVRKTRKREVKARHRDFMEEV